jgi:hypothetical protein
MPFYNGHINRYGTNEYEIDQQTNRFGVVPNNIQFIYDYDPNEVLCEDGLLKSKVMYSNLSNYYDEICSSHSRHIVNGEIFSMADFYANGKRYILMFFGEMNCQIKQYLCNNRPYDFDAEGILEDLCCGIDIYNIYDTKDSCSDDYHIFIPSHFININFDDVICNKFNNYCNRNQSRNMKSKGKKYQNEIHNNSKKVRNKCISVTNKGVACSRMAKDGSEYCGIHYNGIEVSQCISVTAKGVQCGRDVKTGYDYCSIHLKKNKY